MPLSEEDIRTRLANLAKAASDLIVNGLDALGVDACFMIILAEEDTGRIHISTDVDDGKAADFAAWATLPWVTHPLRRSLSMFRRLNQHPMLEPLKPAFKYVTTSVGLVGHFGVVMWCNNEDPSSMFWEPWEKTTEPGEYYPNEQEAQMQAYWYAFAHSLPFFLPGFVEPPDPVFAR